MSNKIINFQDSVRKRTPKSDPEASAKSVWPKPGPTPLSPDERRSETLITTVTPLEKTRFKEEAMRKGLTVSNLLRRMVRGAVSESM